MGEWREREGPLSFLLVLLLCLSTLPLVQAQSGTVLIDEPSFGLSNTTTFFGSELEFTVELHEGAGQSANVSVETAVLSLEGTVHSNQSLSVPQLSANEVRNITINLSNMPLGYSEVVVTLVGDVGVNSTTQQTSISRTVQQLRPLSISFAGESSVTAQGMDAQGLSTSNLTVHDGDFLRVEFPLVNDGDVDWNGTVSFHLRDANGQEASNESNASVLATTSEVFSFSPSLAMVEGELTWWLNLTGNLVGADGVHQLNGTIDIQPPPLPHLEGELSSNAAYVQAGQTLDLNITLWNNATVAFNGRVVCTGGGLEALNATMALNPNSTATQSFSMIARPMTMICTLEGMRVDASSTFPLELNIEMPSAVFESAGSVSPSLNGGPWHKGDIMSANILMRNIGELDGRARLVLSVDGTSSPGAWVDMKRGSAGELTASVQVLSEGEVSVDWVIESDDGVVSGISSGNALYSIRPQQSIQITANGVGNDAETGVHFTLGLHLDEGRSRDVLVRVGYETGDATVYLQEYTIELHSGLYEQQHTFGDVSAEKLVVSIEPVNWVIGPGPLMLSTNFPSEATLYRVEFDQTTNPLRPVLDDEVELQLTFLQSGPLSDATGDVWLVDAYGTILTQFESPDWDGESSVLQTVTITWPKGSTVALKAMWDIEETVVTEEVSYTSGQTVVESTTEWPFGAMVWGLLLGLGAVLVVRLRLQQQPTRTPSQKKQVSRPSSGGNAASNPEEKREIACPECERRLRVPVSYSGSVGCPDCAHKFEVESQTTTAPEPEETTEETTEKPAQEEASTKKTSDGKIEIGCPDCQQTLRIPASYEGSVRCPACKIIFKANEGVAMLE